MRDNFAKCLTFTLQFEGGWSDNPRDPGGATMRGVTWRTFRQFYPRASFSNLRNAPMASFEAIYRTMFWSKIGGDALEPGVDLLAFDIAVNMGPARALEFLRRTNYMTGAARLRTMDHLRLGFWRHLTREWRIFGKGWCRRENACLALALTMNKGR